MIPHQPFIIWLDELDSEEEDYIDVVIINSSEMVIQVQADETDELLTNPKLALDKGFGLMYTESMVR